MFDSPMLPEGGPQARVYEFAGNDEYPAGPVVALRAEGPGLVAVQRVECGVAFMVRRDELPGIDDCGGLDGSEGDESWR